MNNRVRVANSEKAYVAFKSYLRYKQLVCNEMDYFFLSALFIFSSFAIYSLDDVRANYSQLATDKKM